MYRHWKSQVAIVQEGPAPLPQCPRFGIYMQAARLIKNKITESCNQATEIRLRKRDVEISQREGDMEFSLYDMEYEPLIEGVTKFKYLGKLPWETDSDWPEVHRNIKKAWSFWRSMGNILIW